MHWVKKVDGFITGALEWIITIFFIIIFLLVFGLVLLRYGFQTSIIGTHEVINILFVYCSALGTAILVRQREHIKILFFVEKLPVGVKKMVITVNYLLVCVLNAFFLYMSLDWIKSVGMFKAQITKIPYWVGRIPIPICSFMVILYCFYNIYLIYVNPEELYLETQQIDIEVKNIEIEADKRIPLRTERKVKEKRLKS